MSGCLAQGNDSNCVARFGVGDYHHGIAQHAQGDEALLTVAKTPVLDRVGNARENRLCINEVESMLAQIGAPLRLVSDDFHRLEYTYFYAYNARTLRLWRSLSQRGETYCYVERLQP